MDKYQIVMELTDHPEKFSDEEIEKLLQDPEIRYIYNLLCDTDSSLKSDIAENIPDINKEWHEFSARNGKRNPFKRLFRSRAAAVAIITASSVVALALGIGHLEKNNADNRIVSGTAGKAPAAVTNPILSEDSVTTVEERIPASVPVIYENESLDRILTDISSYYGLKLHLKDNSLSRLRLFFRWDQTKTSEEVIKQLNNFDKINLVITDGIITDR